MDKLEASMDLMHDILKTIQGDITTIKHDTRELKSSVTHIHENLHTMDGRLLNFQRSIYHMQSEIERILDRIGMSPTAQA